MAVKPAATGRLLKAGIAVLIAGALLLLLGAVGAFYFWNNNEKHVRRHNIPLRRCFTKFILLLTEHVSVWMGGPIQQENTTVSF